MKRAILHRRTRPAGLLVCCLLVALTAETLSAETQRFYVTQQDSKDAVTFASAGNPEFIWGETDDIQGWFDFDPDDPVQLDGQLQVDLNTLRIGIGLRNEFWRSRHLQTDEFPDAVFELSGLKGLPQQMEVDAPYDFTVLGTFTIHGVPREIEIAAAAVLQDPESDGVANLKTLFVKAEFSIELDDYGIPQPTAPFLRLVENIDIKVVFTATTAEPGQD
jgi:polyisoprenoid-binding protein YceI